MERRQLGKTGLQTSVVGLGCSRFGSFSAGQSVRELVALVDEAVHLGINMFDTADSYGQGDSERVLGRAVKGKRSDVILETKVGYVFSSAVRTASRFKAPIKKIISLFPSLRKAAAQTAKKVRPSQVTQRFDAEYLQSSVNGSLERLATDYIDIFMFHNPSIEVLRERDFLPVVQKLKGQGKIRHFGVSCPDLDSALVALAMTEVEVVQVSLTHEVERLHGEFIPQAVRQGCGIVGRNVFKDGQVFTGAQSDRSSMLPQDLNSAQRAVVDAVANGAVSTVLLGTTKIAHLRENVSPLLNSQYAKS